MPTTATIAEDIITETLATLERDERINLHDSDIDLHEEGGSILLSGTASNIIEKRLVVNFVRQLADDRIPVLDRLRIDTQRVENRALRDALAERLGGEPLFAMTTISVDTQADGLLVQDAGSGADVIQAMVADGQVTLTGTVSSLAHRRMAEVLTWWTVGTATVENLLEVSPAEEDTDNEVTEAVQMVLEKDPLVHADQLQPGTAAGVVVISGSVASDEERQLALSDAWYVPGVWEVVDRTEIHDAPRV